MPKLLRLGARWLLPPLLVIAIPIAVLAAYDVTGVSDPDPFNTGTLPAHTPTATADLPTTSTPTHTVTSTATATPTVTATPRPCASVRDASLEFDPDEFAREGDGPFDVVLALRNNGRQSYAVNVVLALATVKGAAYLDHVDLPGGVTWSINSASASTTHAVGDIAPRGEVDVALRIHMLPAWTAAHNAGSMIRVTIHSAECTRHSSPARATIELDLGNEENAHRAIEGAPASADAPLDIATPTASTTPTATEPPLVATATSTPTALADAPTPEATATPS